ANADEHEPLILADRFERLPAARFVAGRDEHDRGRWLLRVLPRRHEQFVGLLRGVVILRQHVGQRVGEAAIADNERPVEARGTRARDLRGVPGRRRSRCRRRTESRREDDGLEAEAAHGGNSSRSGTDRWDGGNRTSENDSLPSGYRAREKTSYLREARPAP